MVENGNESVVTSVEPLASSETVVAEDDAAAGPLPSNCLPLAHQVAGHFYGKGKTKLGLLQTLDGYVLKPVQSPPRGEREHNFFKRIFSADSGQLNRDEIELRQLLPTYRGSFVHNEIIYIKMDDIGHGIKYPAVIDFKIGQVTHDPEASIEKITRQKSKYPPVEKIGFQLLGMRVFDKKDKTFAHFDKIFGRALSEEDLIHGLALYFQFHASPQLRAIRETLKRFEEIRAWFERQTTYHFFSSSLIVVYEAQLEDILNNNNNCELSDNNSTTSPVTEAHEQPPQQQHEESAALALTLANSVRIVMADFAHVFPANDSIDQNYLYGIRRLIEHLNVLLDPAYKFKDVRALY